MIMVIDAIHHCAYSYYCEEVSFLSSIAAAEELVVSFSGL